MTKKLGFGIIGCGMISKWHAQAIAADDRAVLIGVTDYSCDSAGKAADAYGCKVFQTVDDMLACADIDVVCICTPSGLHAPMAIRAAEAGKHIVVEKPMAITEQQIRDMIEACEANNVKVCVISQLRFSTVMQFVKKTIQEGALGRMISGDVYMKYYRSAEYYQSGGWRGTIAMDGGGALMNQGIHGIDLLQYLMGPVKSVSCMARTLVHDIEVEDTANILVEYESGAIGVIQGTTSVNPGYPRRLSLHGSKGSVVIQEDTVIEWDVEDYPLPEELKGQNSKYNGAQDPGAFATEYHELQISDMITAILENGAPLVDMYEGKKAVEIILAAYKASESGKEELLRAPSVEKHNTTECSFKSN